MLSYLTYFIGNEQRHNTVLKDPNHRFCIVAFFQLPNVNVVNVVITSISGAMRISAQCQGC